jgi:hypothetical protein
MCEGDGDERPQLLAEVENSRWLIWLIRTVITLCFLVTLTNSMEVSNLASKKALQNESRGNKWKAHFFFADPIPLCKGTEDNVEINISSYDLSFSELNTALRKYREGSQTVIRQLSLSHEVAVRTEQLLVPLSKKTNLLSHNIERKISKVAELLERNSFVLESLLRPFPATIGFTKFTCDRNATTNSPAVPKERIDTLLESSGEPLPRLARYIPPYKLGNQGANEFHTEEQPYEEATQIIAHITRDWTLGGAPVRRITYHWIVDQLWKYHGEQEGSSILSPILVPGAGMGRLAYDIAFSHREHKTSDNETKKHYFPFEVEAADSSLVMASAAHHIINNASRSQNEIYPFVNDPFSNEVETELRWEGVSFPENSVIDTLNGWNTSQGGKMFMNEPSLAYTIGDFVVTYTSKAKQEMYGSIATCFFIDTATNIYEYILTIKNLLRHKGLWINVGPVQWHRNAQLQPSTEELKQIIKLFGFKIHHWEIEDRIVGYRHNDDVLSSASGFSRFTRSEGYRPLKFVATLEDSEEAGDLFPLLEKLRFTTGRKSMMHQSVS